MVKKRLNIVIKQYNYYKKKGINMEKIKAFNTKEVSTCSQDDTTRCSSSDATVEKEEQMNFNLELPVAMIGAGPIGLAAAAHLTIKEVPFIVFESGKTVGNNILEWQHIRLFSPWQYDIDKAARKLLEETN